MSSSSKKNVKLSVDNKLLGAVDNFDGQQPSSASPNSTLLTATSTFSAAETPRNQFIGTTFKKEWDKFVGGLEGELKDAFFDNYENVFFDEKALTKYMVIHRQLSGICSSHASAIAQHYIASKRRGDDGDEQSVDHHTMLDISSYIRYKLPKDRQIRYILEGVTGLNSFELLKNFTGTNELDYAQYYLTGGDEFDMRNLYEKFHRHLEPTLVGHFRFCPAQFSKKSSVLDGFMDQSEYDGLAQNNGKASVHAMVLIGAYQSKDKRYWFLLQNSHEGNYFKLISGEYLASCCPKIYFASPNADMELEEGYPVAVGEYSETAAVLEECAWQYPEGEEG